MDFPKVEMPEFENTFRKPKFLYVLPGQHVIRVLGPTLHPEWSHYIKSMRTTIRCLEDECPVCDNNRKLRAENPDKKTNEISGYYPRRWIFYTNVLDRTPVKVCPSCKSEVNAINGNYPPMCPTKECNTMLMEVQAQPSNQIKILSRGITFKDHLELVQKTTLNKEGEPLGIENFDVQLLVPANRQPVPSALSDRIDAVEYNEEDLFDLENVIISLDADEVNQLLRGISLKDIFAARGTSFFEQSVDEEIKDTSNDVTDAINKAKELFD